MARFLVTGAAGFIGSHLCEALLARGDEVVGLDNFDPFYARAVKESNLAGCRRSAGFRLAEGDIRDESFVRRTMDDRLDGIVHLAARAGVRPSIAEPLLYQDVNVRGTAVLLEAAKSAGVGRFIFASSSSVYGNNEKVPFAEGDNVDFPISPYAATKKAGELLVHTYAHLHGFRAACLRFFTVYGPRQRPDLAIHKFTRLILAGEPLPVYGDGQASRDYTYIDDIVDGIVRSLDRAGSYRIFNLGESRPVTLEELIATLEAALGQRARIERLPSQPGDVERTFADVTRARGELGYEPRTPLADGIARFVAWFRARSG